MTMRISRMAAAAALCLTLSLCPAGDCAGGVLVSTPAASAAGGLPGGPPCVGILYNSGQARELPAKDRLAAYTEAVRASGGLPVVLSQLLTPEETAVRLAAIDALLVPGGDDVAPDLYGQEPQPELEDTDRGFDLYELAAIRAAAARKLPILGICKGLQLLNVEAGGTLYQDLPSQLRGPVTHRIRKKGVSKPCYHKIEIQENSLLHKIFKKRSLRVNSYHHQAVDKPGEGYAITARSADGVVEAIEKENILAVQFHPEKDRKAAPAFNAIFEYFIGQARAAAVQNYSGPRLAEEAPKIY